MKINLLALITVIPFALLATPVAYSATQDCATRIDAIEAQIESAAQVDDTRKIARLGSALSQVKTNCTDSGQVTRAGRKVREKQEDVRKAHKEVRNAEENLRNAQAEDNEKKISKAQKRLSAKQDKLRSKMDDLRGAQADLSAFKG